MISATSSMKTVRERRTVIPGKWTDGNDSVSKTCRMEQLLHTLCYRTTTVILAFCIPTFRFDMRCCFRHCASLLVACPMLHRCGQSHFIKPVEWTLGLYETVKRFWVKLSGGALRSAAPGIQRWIERFFLGVEKVLHEVPAGGGWNILCWILSLVLFISKRSWSNHQL